MADSFWIHEIKKLVIKMKETYDSELKYKI